MTEPVDVVKELSELYYIHKERVKRLLDLEKDGPPLPSTSDDLKLLGDILSKLADEIKIPVKTVEQQQAAILGYKKKE